MDAKPQRPVRTLRVRGDENLPPLIESHKTIHQRNKSTPALSTMMNAGGLKAAAKRTAFVDVSNTVKNVLPYKDDSAITGKNEHEVVQKAILLPPEKKQASAALLRPAQRPLTVSGLKGLLNNVVSANQPNISTKKPSTDVDLATANTHKPVAKGDTAIYKDPTPGPVTQEPIGLQQEPPAILSTAPAHQNFAPRHHKSQQYLRTEQPVLRRTRSRYNANFPEVEGLAPELSGIPTRSDESSAVRSDGVYVDARDHAYPHLYSDEGTEEQGGKTYNVNGIELTQQEHGQLVADQVIKEQDRYNVEVKAIEPSSKHEPPSVSEPEEYWDDEEYDDQGEDGYTTARSYPSRGDNTTGGATTILFPQMNVKVKRELAAAKQVIEGSKTVEEIEDESWDTSMVAEYGDEIFQYMRELEIKMLPNAHYMDNQAEIQWSMRSVLMDWLVQVHHRFTLLPETLFLCVNYIDRFLSCKIVSLGKLQLVGATAIFVAAKYEEINCPSVQEIVYMVDNGYTVDEILKAERFMLSMLQFELGWPGPMSFLRRISKADDYDLETRTLAKYFLEITIMDERFVGSPPSYVAAGAHCLARLMLKKGDWSPAHVYYSNYTFSQLRSLLVMMIECCESPQKHHSAVFDKYTDKRYKRASLFVEAEMIKGFQLPASSRQRSLAGMAKLNDLWRLN
ncbi:MAG: hypothetical protein M1835_005934 [Candelina submexicana]|nr:MAG: hypothetical protein M1835_005934 [Candelina submexicana]